MFLNTIGIFDIVLSKDMSLNLRVKLTRKSLPYLLDYVTGHTEDVEEITEYMSRVGLKRAFAEMLVNRTTSAVKSTEKCFRFIGTHEALSLDIDGITDLQRSAQGLIIRLMPVQRVKREGSKDSS